MSLEELLPSNWRHILTNHLSRGAITEAIALYSQIRRTCRLHLHLAAVAVLKTCARFSLLNLGKSLHSESIKTGLNADVVVGTSLLSMYGKCGHVDNARRLFDSMPVRTVVTWNAMIGGYLSKGDLTSALYLFESMGERTAATWNQIIGGYAKSGATAVARELFDKVPREVKNAVTWSLMVDGYASNGEMEAARLLLERMPEKGCFAWSSMVSGYCKSGDTEQGRAVFNSVPVRTLVIWNSLISGLAQNGLYEEALKAFRDMQADDGFEPDEFTFASVLSACAQLGLLSVGREIHAMIQEKGIKPNCFVLNGLLDMYVKCGDIDSAKSIFEKMTEPNSTCWNSMITGFTVHGEFYQAVDLVSRMEDSGRRPDEISFLSAISACAHGGLVEEGLRLLSKMEKYGLSPSIKHYGCLIDLLGRAGRLKEAFAFIKGMPMKPNDTIWGTMLGACRLHSETAIAEEVLKYITSDEFGNDSHYVLLSNIYAASERWEKAENVRISMTGRALRKVSGCSSLMSDNAS